MTPANSLDALKKAKYNVEKHYFFVGVVDRMEETLKLLEYLLPQFYKGALDLYKKTGGPRNIRFHFQPKLSDEGTAYLKNLLEYNYDFYNFVSQRMSRQTMLLSVSMHWKGFRETLCDFVFAFYCLKYATPIRLLLSDNV